MTLRNTLFRAALPAVLAAALSACTTTSETKVSDTQKRVEVRLARLAHTVDFKGGTGLSASEKASLETFLAENRVGYGDVVSADIAGNSTMRRDAIATFLRARGIELAANAPIIDEAPVPGTARLIVERHVAVRPACPDWSKQAMPNYSNEVYPNFGCAHQTNLGLMIANPAHLTGGGGANGTATGESAAKAVAALGEAQPTGVSESGLNPKRSRGGFSPGGSR